MIGSGLATIGLTRSRRRPQRPDSHPDVGRRQGVPTLTRPVSQSTRTVRVCSPAASRIVPPEELPSGAKRILGGPAMFSVSVCGSVVRLTVDHVEASVASHRERHRLLTRDRARSSETQRVGQSVRAGRQIKRGVAPGHETCENPQCQAENNQNDQDFDHGETLRRGGPGR